MKLLLASASPRRLELLKQIGIVPDKTVSPDIDERVLKLELPGDYALRMAKGKAVVIAQKHPDHIVLAGDTVVACGRRILPKCEDESEVAQCLELLSGRRHRIYGGVCVIAPGNQPIAKLVESAATFQRLSAKQLNDRALLADGVGKAGGYALQGRAAKYIRFISGSSSNIIGLPLYETARLLETAGYTCP